MGQRAEVYFRSINLNNQSNSHSISRFVIYFTELGKEHPDTLTSLENSKCVLITQSKNNDAEELHCFLHWCLHWYAPYVEWRKRVSPTFSTHHQSTWMFHVFILSIHVVIRQ